MIGPDLLTIAGRLLAKAAGTYAKKRAERSEAVVQVLQKLGISRSRIQDDFETIYVHAFVEYCVDKSSEVRGFLGDRYVKEMFQRTFVTGNTTYLETEIDIYVERMAEGHGRNVRGSNLRRDAAAFATLFNSLVDEVRKPTEIKAERNELAREARIRRRLDELMDRVAQLPSSESIYEQFVRAGHWTRTPAQQLAQDVRDWFAAIRFIIERDLTETADEFAWIVNVPIRTRRFERVLVLGVAGELSASQVASATRLGKLHRTDCTWTIARLRVSAAARAATAGTATQCFTLDELIDQDADFTPYLEWLEGQIERLGISKQYVQPSCQKEDIDTATGLPAATSRYDRGLEDYVRRWTADPSTEHLSILGEFGTGKTWFAYHFAWDLAQEYSIAKLRGLPRPRVPIVIPLRDYAKAVTVESLFSEFFFRKHEVILPGYQAFEQLNRMGRLLIIFDGFDEMAARVDRQRMIDNFWELARCVSQNAKVVLTCRTEHFPEAKEGRALLAGTLAGSTTVSLQEIPKFDAVEILPFDDGQVREMLGHLTDRAVTDRIMADETLLDLIRRPVMSSLVLAALPDISAGRPVDLARVYMYAVHRKMSEDIQNVRTFTSLADKLYFLSELSWEMLSTHSMSINYKQFPARIRQYFETAVSDVDLDHWSFDMRGQTMLIRDSDGNYSPAHRSLAEFFVAYKMGAELAILSADCLELVGAIAGDNTTERRYRWTEYFSSRRSDGSLPVINGFARENIERLAKSVGTFFDPVVMRMLSEMISPAEETVRVLSATVSETDDSTGYLGAICMQLGLELGGESYSGTEMRDLNLQGLASVGPLRTSQSSSQHPVSLVGTDLRGSNLDNAHLRQFRFQNADLRGATFDPRELLQSWPSVLDVVFSPAGDIVALTEEGLVRWPCADLSKPSAKVQFGRSTLGFGKWLRIVAALDDERVALEHERGVSVVATRTGQVLGKPVAGRGAVASRLNGQDVLLWLDSGRVVARNCRTFKRRIVAATLPTHAGLTPHLVGMAQQGFLLVASSELTFYRFQKSGWSRVGENHEVPKASATVGFDSPYISVYVPENRVFRVFSDGRVVFSALSSDLDDGRALSPRIRYVADRGIGIFAISNNLAASRGSGYGAMWQRRTALGTRGIRQHPDGDSVVTFSDAGDVTQRLLTDGRVVAASSVNERISGLRVSRQGLGAEIVEAIVLAGGSVED